MLSFLCFSLLGNFPTNPRYQYVKLYGDIYILYTLVYNRFAAVSFTDLCNETIGPEADMLKYSNRSLMSIRSVCVLSQSTKHCQESCNISSPIPLKLVGSCIRFDTSDNSSFEKEGLHTRKELHKSLGLSQSNLFSLLRR